MQLSLRRLRKLLAYMIKIDKNKVKTRRQRESASVVALRTGFYSF